VTQAYGLRVNSPSKFQIKRNASRHLHRTVSWLESKCIEILWRCPLSHVVDAGDKRLC